MTDEVLKKILDIDGKVEIEYNDNQRNLFLKDLNKETWEKIY